MRRVVDDRLVDLHHLAGQRRIDVGGGLDAFHHGAGLAGGDLALQFRQFDEHQVAELLLRVVGDADGGDVAVQPHPFVFLGVAFVRALAGHGTFPLQRT